ncbi:hypothetical protein OY671_012592, partial [Metschnikowia pulcherrima]
DPKRSYEASGSAGKSILFAVRSDTFPAETQTDVFYIGTNDPAESTDIRRYLSTALPASPIAGEYMHRDAFDIADVYGKDTFSAIRRSGTARSPTFFALKARVDNFCARFPFLPRNMSDRSLQFFSERCGDHSPARSRDFRARYEHYSM